MISDSEIKNYTLEYIESALKSIPPANLEKHLADKFFLKKKQSKFIVKSLIDNGKLAYKDIYGRTVIETSYNRAVRVSKHIVLVPPDTAFKPDSTDVIIRLLHGASFGTGQHPTTRLSLQGIDYLFSKTDFLKNCNNMSSLLDIGTGSGVLAIAAMKMGIKKGTGTDIDPCAVSEAKTNAKINNLENYLKIENTTLEDLKEKFSLIIANLRFPSLKTIYSLVASLSDNYSAIIMSGVKDDELEKLINIYSKKYFSCQWHRTEKNWGAALFIKTNYKK